MSRIDNIQNVYIKIYYYFLDIFHHCRTTHEINSGYFYSYLTHGTSSSSIPEFCVPLSTEIDLDACLICFSVLFREVPMDSSNAMFSYDDKLFFGSTYNERTQTIRIFKY